MGNKHSLSDFKAVTVKVPFFYRCIGRVFISISGALSPQLGLRCMLKSGFHSNAIACVA